MLALCRQRSPRSAHDCGGLDARRLQSEARCTLSRFRVRHHALPSCTELVRSISADSKTARSRAKVRNPHNRAAWPRRCFSAPQPHLLVWHAAANMRVGLLTCSAEEDGLSTSCCALRRNVLTANAGLRPARTIAHVVPPRLMPRAHCKVGLICSFVLTAEIGSANGTGSAHFAACERARRGLQRLCVQSDRCQARLYFDAGFDLQQSPKA